MIFTLRKPELISWEAVLASAFFIVGLLCISAGSWLFGTISLVLALARGFLYTGIEFDLTHGKFRFFTALFELRMGSWESLPVITGVTVKYFSVLQTTGRIGLRRMDKVESFIVLLSVENSTQGIILIRYKLKHKNSAVLLANGVADYLKVPVRVVTPAAPPRLETQ